MKIFSRLSAGILIALLTVLSVAGNAVDAEARGHFRGGVYIGVPWYGPWYDPWYYGPWYGPGYGYAYPPYYAQPSEYGYLKTVVKPAATEVWVDGKRFGVADDFSGWFHALKLPLGVHEASFRLRGYKTYTVSFTITSDDTTTVTHDLTTITSGTEDAADTGVLVVTTEPSGADVYIDNALTANTGDTGHISAVLTAGRHDVRIVKAGYKVFFATAMVGAGGEVNLNAKLSVGEPDGKPQVPPPMPTELREPATPPTK